MKILVVSDTHGYTDKFDVVLEKEQPVDMLVSVKNFCNNKIKQT